MKILQVFADKGAENPNCRYLNRKKEVTDRAIQMKGLEKCLACSGKLEHNHNQDHSISRLIKMSKGDRRERQFVQILKNAGFATYRPATVAFGENDIFGLFDVLAFSPDYRYNVGVQVKSNRATGIRTWERNTQVFRNLEWITLYAVPVDNKGWRLLECTAEGTFTLVDERSRDCSMGEGLQKWFNEAQE